MWSRTVNLWALSSHAVSNLGVPGTPDRLVTLGACSGGHGF